MTARGSTDAPRYGFSSRDLEHRRELTRQRKAGWRSRRDAGIIYVPLFLDEDFQEALAEFGYTTPFQFESSGERWAMAVKAALGEYLGVGGTRSSSTSLALIESTA